MAAAGPAQLARLEPSSGVLRTSDPVPEASRVLQANADTTVVLHKSTYPANDPSEDRSTVVAGDGFIFAGVWDGHGGTACSEYAETQVWECFQEVKPSPALASRALCAPAAPRRSPAPAMPAQHFNALPASRPTTKRVEESFAVSAAAPFPASRPERSGCIARRRRTPRWTRAT